MTDWQNRIRRRTRYNSISNKCWLNAVVQQSNVDDERLNMKFNSGQRRPISSKVKLCKIFMT